MKSTQCEQILEYMNERNKPYGTKLTLENGAFVLHL